MYQPEILQSLYRIEQVQRRQERKIDGIARQVGAILEEEILMSQELDNLTAQVKSNTDAEQSAVTLLTKLSDLIKASVNDPAALTKLAGDLKGSADQLAAAVVANTPAAGP
jgi:regulator of replication initiation timing